MKLVVRAASFLLMIAVAMFLFAGFRSNVMLRDVEYFALPFCKAHPAQFQIVDMKAPACVTRSAAKKWKDNQLLLDWASAIGAVLFVALFFEQQRSRQRTP